ncbi:hemolysin III family protein [Craurococcus roseus]|uniref:Hemolysin III family protein n=1 Tax=Craurococcus roseus TaxID=77585 RepID=A0ABN1EVH4_9PROT
MPRRYSRGELIADAAVHALGAAFGLTACGMLAAAALPSAAADPLGALGLLAYAAGLVAMLGCSALYNLTPAGARRKALYRRCDRAAIFAMIAGTYTPFAGMAVGGAAGGALLAGVWTAAAAGAAHALLGRPGRRERLAVLLYLLLGWCGVVLIVPLADALSTGALALLVAGGVLYTAGTAFHLADRLPFHNAAWHAFVLGAAACHFAAVLRDIAPAG